MASIEAISAALPIIGKVSNIDMVLYHMGFHPISWWGMNRMLHKNYSKRLAESLLEAKKKMNKPVLAALRPANDLAGMEEFLEVQSEVTKVGLPVFHSLENLSKALSKVIAWRQRRNF